MDRRLKTIAFVGLGSNLGERLDNLRDALRRLPDRDLELIALSSVYESAPWGPLQQQPPFLNCAAKVRTYLDPFALLRRCLALEGALGRQRQLRYGPRTIDLDLLLFGEQAIETPDLIIPHPRLGERAFVLLPLLEIEPGLCDPRDGHPYAKDCEAVRNQTIARVQPAEALRPCS